MRKGTYCLYTSLRREETAAIVVQRQPDVLFTDSLQSLIKELGRVACGSAMNERESNSPSPYDI